MSPVDPAMDEALARAERALDEGRDLRGTGFWNAVGRARSDPALASACAARIAAIDRRAFERGVRARVPLWIGHLVLGLATGAGVAALAVANRLDAPAREIAFLGGVAILLVSTHSPAHWLAGRASGIRFTHYFLGGPPPPRPGVKTDYESYLRASPRARAVMHAAGAVVTKAVPFALVPLALAWNLSRWAVATLLGIGAVQIFTDALLSTKTSDWKKVRRELAALRAGRRRAGREAR